MEFRFHTKVLLFNQDEKILVQKRQDTWKRDLIGWKTEIPEKIEDAIIREIQEETWIMEIKDLHILDLQSNYSHEKDRYFVLVIYKASINTQNPILSDEHQEYNWITKEELFMIGITDYLEHALKKIKL